MRTPMTTGERDGLEPRRAGRRSSTGSASACRWSASGHTLDIAEAILYLASDDSAYVTGQEIVVDGGYVVR